jgi:hypothetical protein
MISSCFISYMSFALVRQNKTGDSKPSMPANAILYHSNNSARSSHDSVIHFIHPQCTFGNQCVQTFIPSGTGFDFGKIGIKPKLKISQPGDIYEQEADKVAEEVMRTSAPQTYSPQLQNNTKGLDRKCDACEVEGREEEEKRLNIRRKPSSNSLTLESPDEVTDSLNNIRASGGSPLDSSTKEFMESRFNFDFSNVRIHTDEGAAKLAQTLNARGFTVGYDIVFRNEEYTPTTTAGKKLLAHELAHVIQQKDESPKQVGNTVDGKHNLAREKCDTNMQLTSSRGTSMIQRWKKVGNTATSDSDFDTLSGLSSSITGSELNWPCIMPVKMQSPKAKGSNYPSFIWKGDEFDVSNLTLTNAPSLRIYLFNDLKDIGIAKKFYPGIVQSPSSFPDVDIRNAAKEGKEPISEFLIFGHSSGDLMFGGEINFKAADFNPAEDSPTFENAKAGQLPRRCWFTHSCSARSVGCDSETWGNDFASHYLRKGGSKITTTTKSVRPKCFASDMDHKGGCIKYNGLEFAESHHADVGITLDGPFWTVSDFHASRFWKIIAGKL